MIKKILFYTIVALIISCEPIVYSFFHPWEIRFIDDIRLIIQSEIMATAWDYIIDDLSISKYPKNQSINAIGMQELKKYINKLEPWDILFTDSEKYITSEIIPGKWKHAIIYIGTKKQVNKIFKENQKILDTLSYYFKTWEEVLIIDSQSDGVKIRELKDVSNLKNKSLLIALSSFRIKWNTKEFINYALNQIWKDYDYDLITNNTEKLYCSELIFEWLKNINIIMNIYSDVYWRPVVLADDEVKYIITDWIKNNEFKMIFFLEKENGKLKQKNLKDL